jgi:hypothetical protein
VAKVHYESPENLIAHPLLQRVGMMESLAGHFANKAKKAGKNRDEHKERAAELESDWRALCESVRKNGILEPIKVSRHPIMDRWEIVDGRNRWNAAKEVGLKWVPVLRVSPEAAAEIIATTVAARRHYSKGSTAYLAILLNPAIATDGDARKKAAHFRSRTECGTDAAPGPALSAEPENAITAEAIALKFSVSPRLLEQAAELYRLLEEHPMFRDDAEADVWAGCGLGGVLAGVKSLITLGTRNGDFQSAEYKAATAAWGAVTKFATTCKATWERWAALDAERQEKALEVLRDSLSGAPDFLREQLKSAL